MARFSLWILGLLPFSVLLPQARAQTFADITKSSGLHEPLAGIMGHGGAWGDFDGDGKIDLFVGGFCDRPNKEYAPAAGPVPARLFRNLGGGKFEQVKQPGLEFFARTSGAVFADLDNDGWLELYAANNAKNVAAKPKKGAKNPLDEKRLAATVQRSLLFHNQKGQLVDVSQASGACPQAMLTARNIGVLDYDGDGLLDLLVVEDRFTKKPRTTLLRNLGNMKFQEVTREAGLPEDVFGLGLAVADVNGDGRPDFFVPHGNRFFLSKMDGRGRTTYHEPPELAKLFAWKALDNEDWPCGAAFGDLNRDGKLDLVVSIHGMKARNKVYLGLGVDKDGLPRFRDVTAETGMAEIVPVRCPHVEIQDFDNDGWPDIYLSAAWLDKDGQVTPLIYRNQGNKGGKPGLGVPHYVAPRPIQAPMVYYPAGPSGDFDNDGRLDLFLINWFQGNHCRLLHNTSPKKNWLQVQVTGKDKTNRMGIGCLVTVHEDLRPNRKHQEFIGMQEVATGFGYASGQPAICHFGLGNVDKVIVQVKTPRGLTVRREAKANQRLNIEVD